MSKETMDHSCGSILEQAGIGKSWADYYFDRIKDKMPVYQQIEDTEIQIARILSIIAETPATRLLVLSQMHDELGFLYKHKAMLLTLKE